jgi:hypothetical protein
MSSPTSGVPGAAVQIHVTPSFVADFGELERQIGAASETVYEQLLSALECIREQTPQNTLPITPYGSFGDSFQYRLTADYVFTFKRVTDRDFERRPTLYHYFLKNLLRVRP